MAKLVVSAEARKEFTFLTADAKRNVTPQLPKPHTPPPLLQMEIAKNQKWRLLADDMFLAKVAMECGVGMFTKKQWIKSRSVRLEEQKMQIELEMLEQEKQRFKWQKFSKKDREQDRMKMKNERKRLENERMVLELKRMEMSLKTSQST